MGVSLNLDYEQIKALVDQLPTEEAEQLGTYLRRKVALERLEALQKQFRDVPITDEEITAEVEAVREEMYREGRHRH